MKTMKRTLMAAMVVGGLLWSGAALAQDKVEYKKKTILDLTGATIEGELTKPEGSYVLVRKISKFSSLIQLRGDFRPELLNSHNDL